MTTAVIYVRISQDRSGAGLGVERQEQDCRALAERHGWTVARVFTDNDFSAFSGKRRPAYGEMLTLLRTGAIEGVLCWHTDRLHRSPVELEEYIAIAEEQGITTRSVQAGEIDLATPSGRAVARTLGTWARFESEHKAERVKRAMHQRAASGQFTGGVVPFGWTMEGGKPALERAEAEVVDDAMQKVLAGRSLGSIIRDINARGIVTRTGRPFVYATLRAMLLRPRNAGLISWNGDILGASDFPPIVSRDEWETACRILTDPARRKSQSTRVKHLLAGLAVCGVCGEPMKSASASNRDGSKRTVYRCKTTKAGHPVRNAAILDELVAEVTIARLSQPDAATVFASNDEVDVDGLHRESIALQQRQDNAAEQYADGEITGSQMAKITARIQDKLAAISDILASVQNSPAVGELLATGNVRTAWEVSSIESKRAVIDALMHVTIHPTGKAHGKSFDLSSVSIEPKQ